VIILLILNIKKTKDLYISKANSTWEKEMAKGKNKSGRQSKKENDKLFDEAYLSDPEYRVILIKKIVQEDKDIMLLTDELAKLFQD